jgi:hypothetical protein
MESCENTSFYVARKNERGDPCIMLTFSQPTLHGASREQYSSIYRGIDELLKSDEFPTGSRLYLIPANTDMLEVKLTLGEHTVSELLENETNRCVQDTCRKLLKRLLATGGRN